MIIDLIFIVFIILATWKGYNKGLIIAAFSFLAFIIGIAAAVKFSAVVAGWLGKQVSITQQWLPLISFALVFIGVSFLVKLGAAFIEKTVQFVMMGWLNKLGGILFFVLLYVMIGSVLLFYAEQLKLIQPATIKASQTYAYVAPIGPKVLNGIGTVIPVFKDLFAQLQDFFDQIPLPK